MEVMVDCSSRALTKIPTGIPTNATNLTLTINHIPYIQNTSFQGLNNITEIDMRCNCVPIKVGPKDRMCTQSVTLDNGSFWELKNLKSLYLDGNQLSSIPKGLPPNVVLLSLEVNSISSILKENLTELTNIEWINRTSVNIPRLATDVNCASPGNQRGQSVIFLNIQACQHSSLSIILSIVTTSVILSTLMLAISSHLFLWDMWYIYHFCLAKLKGYRRLLSEGTAYDAFIVYDTADAATSNWVLQELRVQLEDVGEPRLQLCLQDRDWVPGCALVENLSQSIQLSQRTVFVLTGHFIRSGHFKTAFYLAHQRLMDEKNDVIILIFLEKFSSCYSKYLRLRKRLYKRSVLEWPQNPQAQRYFWFCLRNSHSVKLPTFVCSCEFHGISLICYNRLESINQSTFSSKQENHLRNLCLHKNPFRCTCDILDFILWIRDSDVKIPRLATSVKCNTPQQVRGIGVIFFDIKECIDAEVAFLAYFFSTSFIFCVTFVATVMHMFYWDASYVFYYLKAKLKGYQQLSSAESVYDAFITYDTKDPLVSDWVLNQLRVQLEERGERLLPVCLEERDWVPGCPVLESMAQSIQQSRKTVFVLTRAYVTSGAFKMAVYLAHQRLLDESEDVIVLLLLEPSLPRSHFLRLRKRLCGHSVLEWPHTPAAEPWFWQNLRNAIHMENRVMYNKIYSSFHLKGLFDKAGRDVTGLICIRRTIYAASAPRARTAPTLLHSLTYAAAHEL
ncbi:hypothetical protein P4O66_007980 [Electrophorus voltai]|uniref:TIR domain-containing protein n=1 Tax=Electrophorus voltai TaxID=2609070 RepID=A0AAD9DYR6_9TELE|nr:hypothetical protein P4O66_007980 [Electrophorus voltai]